MATDNSNSTQLVQIEQKDKENDHEELKLTDNPASKTDENIAISEKDKCKPEPLYFIYDDNIMGPYLIDEIKTLYIKNKFKNNKIWVQNATDPTGLASDVMAVRPWYELIFPTQISSDQDSTQISSNKDILEFFPDLYDNLIKNILCGRIQRSNVILPTNIPKDVLQSSWFSWFTKKLGKILFFLMECILGIHCIGTLFIALLLTFFAATCCSAVKGKKINFAILMTADLGMAISPILIVYFILTSNVYWNEIQSWMVAYTSWGVISFTISTIYLSALAAQIPNKILNSFVFLIIGVDLGDFDQEFKIIDFGFLAVLIVAARSGWQERQRTKILFNLLLSRDSVGGIGRFFVFPALASLLPASICGFIANYVLEEKYELKCGENISNEFNLCFDDSGLGTGCCEIISSHDYRYSYSFIGGLASNIVAIWAIIRVTGYLIVNASSSMSIYATRKK